MASPPRRLAQHWRVPLIAGLALAGLYLALPDGQAVDALYLLAALAAVATILAALRRQRHAQRPAWILIATGVALTATGDLLWYGVDLLGASTLISVADVAYLGFYVAVGAGLWRMGRRRRGDHAAALDAAIVGVAAVVIGWIVLVAPYLNAADLRLVERLILLAYPAGSLAIGSLAVRLLLASAGRSTSVALVLAGLVAYLPADILYVHASVVGGYQPGGITDALWLVGYAFFAAAAWHPDGENELPARGVRVTSRVRFAALVVAALVAPVVVLATSWQGSQTLRVAALGTVVLVVLVLSRMRGLLHRLREQAERLRRLSDVDPLTGMHNRRYLDRVLPREIARAQRSEAPLSVALLDLDHFKPFNDRFGHAAGDALLGELARRWQAELRPVDVLARYGGEEFVLVLPDCSAAEARLVIERLRDLIPAAQTCSAGIAAHDGETAAEDLLRRADQALYTAKRSGRDAVVIAGPRVGDALTEELRHALDRGELRLHYQPIVQLATGRVVGAEALLRWQHPTRGLLTPVAFLDELEALDLLGPVGAWVIETAIADRADWPDDTFVSINVSPTELRHACRHDLVGHLERLCARHRVPAHDIWIEVTEQAIGDLDSTREVLHQLRELGVRLALDDFGTGYSSLARLRDLPFDVCKLDRSFTATLAESGGRSMVRAVLAMARAFGMTVLTEGIETAEQLAALDAMGCELGQGYHLYRPMSADTLRSLRGRHWTGHSPQALAAPDPEGSAMPTPDHRVLYYEDDHDLSRWVGDYLAPALKDARGQALVIATPAHREQFTRELIVRGVDVAAARAADRLRELDAAELLADLRRDGIPDADALGERLSDLIADDGDGPVVIFGEMVVLLWEQGEVAQALALEETWNVYLADRAVRLLCAYPTALLSTTADGLEQVAQHHSHLGTDHREWVLPVTESGALPPSALQMVRSAITETVRARHENAVLRAELRQLRRELDLSLMTASQWWQTDDRGRQR